MIESEHNYYANITPESTTQLKDIYISYHPKPVEYDMYEWVSLCEAYHEARGREIKLTECVTKFKPTPEPYPLERKIESYGLDVHWRQP